MIRDFWKSYFRIEAATYEICCAHLQRERVHTDEQMNQSRAKSQHDLLRGILHRRKDLKVVGMTVFFAEEWDGFSVRYDYLIQQGFTEKPIPEKMKEKLGYLGKGKIICLLGRFRNYKADGLCFANNEAERSIRFSEVKQKGSGCF